MAANAASGVTNPVIVTYGAMYMFRLFTISSGAATPCHIIPAQDHRQAAIHRSRLQPGSDNRLRDTYHRRRHRRHTLAPGTAIDPGRAFDFNAREARLSALPSPALCAVRQRVDA